MHFRGKIYSSDPNITLAKLKEVDFFGQNDDFYTDMDDMGISRTDKLLSDYPSKLITHSVSPFGFYSLGNKKNLTKITVGIVGSRQNSNYAYLVLKEVFEVLKKYDIITVSGMAKGVDQLAHDFSIEHGIPTIAVLGGGIGNYYKSADKELIQKIVDSGGSVLSQFKHNFFPTNYSFPTRNQFIAAMSDILIVPEAGKDSGSLITVDYMLQLNKKVYGVPGNFLSHYSYGIHDYVNLGKISLLTGGAHLQEIVESLFKEPEQIKLPPIDLDALWLYNLIVENKLENIDQILQQSGLLLSDLLVRLTDLEIAGYILKIANEIQIIKKTPIG